ncbi:MFS transporter [Myxococcota bacterium]|nr:MFS transporter [Myxococcota bacterium]
MPWTRSSDEPADARVPPLSGAVILLGLTSLLNDVASDMVAPLLPVLLATTLGAGPAAIGLVEGVAEAASSLVKLAAGRLSDRVGAHKALAVGGYSLSNLVRPLIALAGSWPVVLGLRFADRVGKGIRTAPRDALLAAAAPAGARGRAFGLHRSMDHAGAAVGPLVAAGLLALGLPLQTVFLCSALPGLVAVLVLALGVRAPPIPRSGPPPPLSWRLLPLRARRLVVATACLALGSVPDAFLVLWLAQAGLPLPAVPLVWAAVHGLRALVALPAGRLSDRVGRVPVLVGGWGLRALVLIALPWWPGPVAAGAMFLAYGAATASTEGAERAVIGDAVAPDLRGTAFGLYHATAGLLALPAAAAFGLAWEHLGAPVAFRVAAALVALAVAAVLVGRRAAER